MAGTLAEIYSDDNFETSYNAIKLNQTLEMRPFRGSSKTVNSIGSEKGMGTNVNESMSERKRKYMSYFANALLPPYWSLTLSISIQLYLSSVLCAQFA